MKSHNRDFSDSLLQQFNFGEATEEAVAKESEEATTEHDSEAEPEDKDQPALKKTEGAELEANSSIGEENEGDLRKEKVKPPQMVPPRRRQKHIIGDDEDESEE